MAQHDYINRKRPQRGKNKKKPAKKPFPLIRVLLAVALLIGAAAALYLMFTNADPDVVEQIKKQNQVQPKEPEIKKPQTPEFINEIKQAEIEVEVKEIEQKGPYVMQCGSFRTQSQAEQLKAKIAFVGLLAEVKRTEGSNGIWYKVRLGPYPTKRGAESDKNKLKRQAKIMGCGIWLWR